MTGPTQHPASNSEGRKRRAHDAAQRLRDETDDFMRYIQAVAWDEGHATCCDDRCFSEGNPYRSAS